MAPAFSASPALSPGPLSLPLHAVPLPSALALHLWACRVPSRGLQPSLPDQTFEEPPTPNSRPR